ncbi:unnamed protein product [Macrosiphum euphorbiae]|uniref:Uncharacterized protein n=1 Tax=Macrosiphum euphorbiae TaxID=13131 RepID=A0AAV0YBI2_9HEMI|nr:unnamed protein product [Macrosiphum euphorbiae]
MPIRLDSFIQEILPYYRGDNLLHQGMSQKTTDIHETSQNPEAFNIANDKHIDEDSNVNIENNCITSAHFEESHGISLKQNNEFITYNHPIQFNSSVHINHDFNNTCSHSEQEFDAIVHTSGLVSPTHNAIYSNSLVLDEHSHKCLMCANGHIPTGMHRCQLCKKALHLFGCSVPADQTEEGCGEARICLKCNDTNKSIDLENKATENWKGQGTLKVSQPKKRSAKSYLNKQPAFEHIIFNKKGLFKPIFHLKNGSSLCHNPILIPGTGKLFFSNTCSADSILSILACSAADSKGYKKILTRTKLINNTSKFILKMITQCSFKNIYKERALLLLNHFENNMQMLVGGLKQLDIIGTIKNVAEKLLEEFPSYRRINECSDFMCENFSTAETSSTVISLNAFDGQIDLETEILRFYSLTCEVCTVLKCGKNRNIEVEPTSHLLIELVSVPLDLHTSVSYTHDQSIEQNKIYQNYGGVVIKMLDSLPKNICIHNNDFILRGIIAFNAPEKSSLRINSGHY